MRASVDRLVTHAKLDTNASMNVLKSFFGVEDVASNLKTAVKDVFSQRNSGFTRIVKIGRRSSDGALMSRITWVSPVVYGPAVAKEAAMAKSVKTIKAESAKSVKSVKSTAKKVAKAKKKV